MEEWDDTDSADVAADIETTLARRPSSRTAALRAAIMPHLIAYGARHPDFNKAFRMRMLEPMRARLLRLLDRAAAEGRLSPEFDRHVGVALLVGPMFYNWMATLAGAALPDDLATRVADSFWKAHGVASHAPSPRRRRAAPRR